MKVKYFIVMLTARYSGSVAWLAREWYYIVGPVVGCIATFAVGWYICKRRRAGKKRSLIKVFYLILLIF